MMAQKQWIFLIMVLLLYLAALSFDLGVTYSVYKNTPDRFFEGESNTEFVKDIRSNGYFLLSSEIFIAYSIMLFIIISYILVRNYDDTLSNVVFIMLSLFMILKSFIHFWGGTTWL